jgi:SAM-dependent methyltransferase
MNCCCPHSVSANRLFSFFARRYRKRFNRKGFEPSQKQLLTGLQQAGYGGKMVLEIGSGVGHLHQTLLEQGAQSAVGIDLASSMIEEAEAWAVERGLSDRTRYYQADFMNMEEVLEAADVVILDKVVCCYPDADGLVHKSLSKTRQVYALTYPRDRWYVRAGIAFGAFLMKLIRSDFRPYLHDPIQVEQWITESGFKKIYVANTPIWLTQVFERK